LLFAFNMGYGGAENVNARTQEGRVIENDVLPDEAYELVDTVHRVQDPDLRVEILLALARLLHALGKAEGAEVLTGVPVN
jgi:hypothetical protein